RAGFSVSKNRGQAPWTDPRGPANRIGSFPTQRSSRDVPLWLDMEISLLTATTSQPRRSANFRQSSPPLVGDAFARVVTRDARVDHGTLAAHYCTWITLCVPSAFSVCTVIVR